MTSLYGVAHTVIFISPSKMLLFRESGETIWRKVEIGGKNLWKHFLGNISFRLLPFIENKIVVYKLK